MSRKVLFIGIPIIAIIAIIVIFVLNKSSKFEIIDEIYDQNEGGNTTFLFVSVNPLDSLKVLSVAKELMQKRIIDKFKNKDIPKDENHMNMMPEVLIVYLYKADDTTAIPEKMQEMIKKRFSQSPIFSENLAYISQGFIYSGVYYTQTKQQTLDTLSPKTVLFVPKKKGKAKEIMEKFKES